MKPDRFVKTGYCVFQTRRLGSETGQYRPHQMTRFTYSDRDDSNDRKPWTAGDDADLINEVK